MSEETPSTTKQVIGLLLIVGGLVWMTAAALISLGFATLIYSEAPNASDFLGALPMILIVGGFLTGLGFVFYVVGWALRA